MDKKLSLTALTSVVVTAIVVLLFERFTNDAVDNIEAGQDAATIEQIETVLKEAMVLDTGETYGAALSDIKTELATAALERKYMKDALERLTE